MLIAPDGHVCIDDTKSMRVPTMAEIEISRWEDGSVIRLPEAILRDLGVQAGEKVQLAVENGKGIIEPVRARCMTLEWILSETDRLGPGNALETVDWGPGRGSEIIDDEYPEAGDIVWVDLNPARGSEQAGRHPTLVPIPGTCD